MEMKLPARVLSEGEIAKNHVQLGHCSGNTSTSATRDAQMHCHCDLSAIQKVSEKCKCRTASRRIAHPSVACWLGKYNGEIADLDIISQFADCVDEELGNEYPSLLMIGSLPRCINCPVVITKASIHSGHVFMNDWVSTIGKPRRAIADRGGPTFQGPHGRS